MLVQAQGGVRKRDREMAHRLGRSSRWVGKEVRPEPVMSREAGALIHSNVTTFKISQLLTNRY